MKKTTKRILSISAILAAAGSFYGSTMVYKNRIKYLEEKNVKFKKYYNLLNEWMKQEQEGKKLEDAFIDRGLKEIAVYGMGEIGQRLCQKLEGTAVKVGYGIDQYGDFDFGIPIIEPGSMNEPGRHVDAVVVSAIADYEDILQEIEPKCTVMIISLEEIIFGL